MNIANTVSNYKAGYLLVLIISLVLVIMVWRHFDNKIQALEQQKNTNIYTQ